MSYPRRNPLTFGYVLVLIVTYFLVTDVLSTAAAERLVEDISTTPYNLAHDPLGSVIGSTLVVDTDGPLLNTLLTNGFSIALCLAVLERAAGTWRAAGTFLAGHVFGTLVATAVTVTAIHFGRYPASVAQDLDYGVSYGALAAAAAITLLLPRRVRLPWVLFVVIHPFSGADWYGDLPDFTTVGHFVAALSGLVVGFVLFRKRIATGFGPREIGSEVTSVQSGEQRGLYPWRDRRPQCHQPTAGLDSGRGAAISPAGTS